MADSPQTSHGPAAPAAGTEPTSGPAPGTGSAHRTWSKGATATMSCQHTFSSHAHTQTCTQNRFNRVDWLSRDSHSDAGGKLLHTHGPLDLLFAERQQVYAERMAAEMKKQNSKIVSSSPYFLDTTAA